MDNPTTKHQKLDRVAKLYLLSQFCQALYFTWPVWYGFASQTLSPVQIGVYFSLLAITKVLAEVPTGAFADKYGRKMSGVAGAAMQIFVPLIWYFGHDFNSYLVAGVISGIGWAFTSGSTTALLYDHKNISKEVFRKVAWLEITAFQSGLLFAAVAGGFLFGVNPLIPFILEALAAAASMLFIAMMEEERTKKSAEEGSGSYISYFRDGFRYLLASRYLRVLVTAGVAAILVIDLGVSFVNESTMIHHGLDPWQRGLLIGAAKILGIIIVNFVLWKVLPTDRHRLIYIAAIGTLLFAVLSIDHIGLFLAGYALFNWLSATTGTIFTNIMHDHIPSSHRATALSGFSALCGFAVLIGGVTAGSLIATNGAHAPYLVAFGLFVCIVSPCTYWLVRRSHNTDTMPVEPATHTPPH